MRVTVTAPCRLQILIGMLALPLLFHTPCHAAGPKMATLDSFTGGPAGSFPEAGLAIAPNGVLYGTTYSGGTSGWGTVFELIPPATKGQPWTQKTLYSFTGGADGANPMGNLVFGSNNVLYGTTYQGGSTGFGTVFQLTPATGGVWNQKTLYTFQGGTDGAYPEAGVIQNSSTLVIYGTTLYGGSPNCGTAFSLSPVSGGGWTEQVVYTFQGGTTDGANPQAPPTLGGTGLLYGTTANGGSSGYGTVYSLTITGGTTTESVLYSFTGLTDGGTPQASLLLGTGGVLYGSTFYAGSSTGCTLGGYAAGCGTIFQLTPPVSGGVWTYGVIHAFTGAGNDGAHPFGSLAVTGKGVLYGSTFAGGSSNDTCFPASYSGCGTIFALRPPAITGGSWTGGTLLALLGKNGGGPNGVLLAPTGLLYGTTYNGGIQGPGFGTLFQVTP
jgi:uncharacterized repeat protein (TIGR03803 family)